MKWSCIITLSFCAYCTALYAKNSEKRDELFYQDLAQRIWQNESGCSLQKLVWWNEGESFMSLGIGHFLWFPQGNSAHFTQTFPELLVFIKKHHQKIPQWLENTRGYCPWKNREEVIKGTDHRLQELRTFLQETIILQAHFIVQRFETSCKAILNAIHYSKRTLVKNYIATISKTSQGLYALIDYVNFKGDGTNKEERYYGQGWGLLQVLIMIDSSEFKYNPCTAFVTAAKKVLVQRVENAPPERNEKRWLAGWINRIHTYV